MVMYKGFMVIIIFVRNVLAMVAGHDPEYQSQTAF